jgi:hypothetical protein
MGTKVKTTLYIDKEVVQKGKDFGLNISKVAENAIKDAIVKLEAPSTQMGQLKESKPPKRLDLVDWEGFEPPTSAMPRRRSYD